MRKLLVSVLWAVVAFGLSGSVEAAERLDSGVLEQVVFEDRNVLIIEFLFEPGASLGNHISIIPGVLSVVEGQLTIAMPNGSRSTLGPGSAVPIPIEQERAVMNMRPTPCRIQIILMKEGFTGDGDGRGQQGPPPFQD